MKGKAFIDTNIFIYLYSEDEPNKKASCIEHLDSYACITSTQAINELSNVFTKKWKFSAAEIGSVISEIQQSYEIKLIDVDVITRALKIHEVYGYAYYDCLMLSSAILNNCAYIFSEDMQDGQNIDGLEIVNIFKREI